MPGNLPHFHPFLYFLFGTARLYLSPAEYVDSDHPDVRAFAREVVVEGATRQGEGEGALRCRSGDPRSLEKRIPYVSLSRSSEDVRRLLIKNLVSEEGLGGEPPHLQLLIEFGEEIGLNATEFYSAEPILEVDGLCNFYARIFYGGTIVEAAAGFNLAFEGLLAREYPKIAEALKSHYHVSPKGLRFWEIHVEADAEHSGDGETILNKYATTAELQSKARRAALVGLEHRYVAMDGIFRRFSAASNHLHPV